MEAQGFPISQQEETSDESINKNTSGQIRYFANDYASAVQGCQAIVMMTEWDEFKSYDYCKLAELMEEQFDEQNLAVELSFYDLRSYIDLSIVKNSSKFKRVFRLGQGYL